MIRTLRGTAVLVVIASIGSILFFSVPALAGENKSGSPPRWGLTARGGYYGVPDWLLDMLFEEHPGVDGTIVGGELRYYGKSGPSGIFSLALTFDVGRTEGVGVWRESAGDTPVVAGGSLDIVAATLTAYFDIVPSSALHPYFGLGLGASHAKGTYTREGEDVNVKEYIPAVHIPVGIVLNLGEHFGLAAEGRIINGLSWGGNLQIRF